MRDEVGCFPLAHYRKRSAAPRHRWCAKRVAAPKANLASNITCDAHEETKREATVLNSTAAMGTKQGYGQTSGLQLASGAGWGSRARYGRCCSPALESRAAGRAGRCTQDIPCATARPSVPRAKTLPHMRRPLAVAAPPTRGKALLQAVLPSRAAAPGARAATRSIRSAIGLFLRISYLP